MSFDPYIYGLVDENMEPKESLDDKEFILEQDLDESVPFNPYKTHRDHWDNLSQIDNDDLPFDLNEENY